MLGTLSVEGFVTPRSQQGLPTIAEVVEGFPSSGLQLMTRVGEFFRVARTEVMQVPYSSCKAHTPHHHEQSHYNTRDSPSGASKDPTGFGRREFGFADVARHPSWERMVHPLPLHRLLEGMALC